MNQSEALFYDHDQIEAQLKCPKCANKLVDPVFLPCGASACKQCLSNLFKSQDPNSTSIECPSCALSHSFPQTSPLIPNLLLANILRQRPMDIERIRHVCEFKSRLADIDAKLGCMERMMADGGREEIREWHRNLRLDVLLVAEKRVQRIHEMSDCLLDQLAVCERQSLEKIDNVAIALRDKHNLNLRLKEYNQLKLDYKNQLAEWLEHEKCLQEPTRSLDEFYQRIQTDLEQMNPLVSTRSKCLFLENKNQALLDSDFIGVVVMSDGVQSIPVKDTTNRSAQNMLKLKRTLKNGLYMMNTQAVSSIDTRLLFIPLSFVAYFYLIDFLFLFCLIFI